MWPRQNQNGLPRGKRVKSAEMHQLHEAFQYLLKRKALQVRGSSQAMLTRGGG